MRTVALDVHKRFCEVAVHEEGEVRRLGRVETTDLRRFAQSRGQGDDLKPDADEGDRLGQGEDR